jgi:aldose 1-epimerase
MMKRLVALALALPLAAPGIASAADAERRPFGTLPDGQAVEAITLSNAKGMRATILSYGAILQSVEVPDRAGRTEEVTLGYADLKGYLDKPNYFGASVGRYANRIKAGRFSIDGKQYRLALNNNGNALHGGLRGYDKRLWIVRAPGSTIPTIST